MPDGLISVPRPERRAARLIVVDPTGRLLLFRFTPADRPPFWATPGGGVDPGETFAQAARRELLEETGIIADPGMEVARRENDFTLFDGTDVRAVERYYLVRVEHAEVSDAGHTDIEREWMLGHRWWRLEELQALDETLYPADILDLWQVAMKGGSA